jgi:mono/diheme cytochrome c family protein
MRGMHLHQQRRRFGLAMGLMLVFFAFWCFSPGIPVLWGPYARASVKEAGRELFVHEWQPNDPLAGGDGLGPVFNASSCVACHFQGGVGGGGPVQHNVQIFDVHPTPRDPEMHAGIIHRYAVDSSLRETPELLHKLFPAVKGRTEVRNDYHGGCAGPVRIQIPDFNPVTIGAVNPTALFGDGWIDRISAKAITNNRLGRGLAVTAKEFNLDFDFIPVGRLRVLPGDRVGKFGWKNQFATLEDFVAAACANELGLGNPLMDQAKPLGATIESAPKPDLNRSQFRSLVAFVDTLPRPVEVLPDDPKKRDTAVHGKELFGSIGCAVCHVPDLGGVQGVYSDFLLYSLEATGTQGSAGGYGEVPAEMPPLPSDLPRPDEWKTPPLWGVADSAPYFHDGRSKTLRDAILRHGRDAAEVTKAFKRLSRGDQEAVIAFLTTLKAPAEAEPASVQVAMR